MPRHCSLENLTLVCKEHPETWQSHLANSKRPSLFAGSTLSSQESVQSKLNYLAQKWRSCEWVKAPVERHENRLIVRGQFKEDVTDSVVESIFEWCIRLDMCSKYVNHYRHYNRHSWGDPYAILQDRIPPPTLTIIRIFIRDLKFMRNELKGTIRIFYASHTNLCVSYSMRSGSIEKCRARLRPALSYMNILGPKKTSKPSSLIGRELQIGPMVFILGHEP